ncbi:hypothetical protein [Nitratifractor sp.]
MKKTLLGLLVLLVTVGAVFFFFKGRSHYDPRLYTLEVRPADKPFGIGSTISFTLPDQFGKAHSLSPDTRKLVFAFSKATGHIVKAYMADKPKGFLEKHKAVIIADISPMPTVILNTFALPDLRKSDYPMLLIYDPKMAKRLEEGQPKEEVIVMTLDRGKVVHIDRARDTAALDKVLK